MNRTLQRTSGAYPERLELLVDGEWRSADGRETLAVINPATEREIGRVPVADDTDIDDALRGARDSFEGWSHRSAWDRAALLVRAAAIIDERRRVLSEILTLENGKPLADSDGEIDRVIESILYCAEESKRAYGRILPPRIHRLSQCSVKRAIGPVAAFAPWNFPAFLTARKVAAALAAGCTIIVKPAEETPAVCIELARAFLEAGLPKGVLNMLFGRPAQISERLIASPIIRKVSFTGSVSVGRLLATQAAQRLKPVTMELGGHAPVVVFDDVNAERAARACVAFKFRNAGQVCLSPSRFFVHAGIAAQFTQHFTKMAAALRVGDGRESGVQMGPLNNRRRLEATAALVEGACGAGARVESGGAQLNRPGYFFAPTVLTNVAKHSRILTEEPFCPVAPIISFETMDDVIERANAVDLGLAAYAFTNRTDRAAEFTERVEAGWIGVNNFTPSLADAPIGGIKDSGLGYEGGPEGLQAYMHLRFVSQSNALV